MLSNYQFLGHGGEGWLRLLHFKPADGVLSVYTYSPWLKEFREEAGQQFDLDAAFLMQPSEGGGVASD